MNKKTNEEKPKTNISTILKGAGIVSLAGLISFLGTIFMTRASHSAWQQNFFYPTNHEQDIKINTLEINYKNIDRKLNTIITKLENFKRK